MGVMIFFMVIDTSSLCSKSSLSGDPLKDNTKLLMNLNTDSFDYCLIWLLLQLIEEME